MVRLDKNKIRSSLGRRTEETPTASQETVVEPAANANMGGNELEKFSQYVLKQLITENIPTTPNNFQIYFEKMLESRPMSFRKRINELLETESANDDDHRATMEKEVREGFSHIKGMLQSIATVYKNLNVMKNLTKKRIDEINVNAGQLAMQNVLTAFEEDLNKLSSLMDRQLSTLKEGYEKAGSTLKVIEQEAIFDTRYAVYNKKYLMRSLEKERESIKQYGYATTLMILKVKDEVLGRIPHSRDRAILLRNIAKLLLKTSRRSDIVAHYGEGLFAMIMKHTNIESAKKACERIADLIYATSFFIGEMELDIDIELAIVELQSGKSVEESLSAALDAMPMSGKYLEPYAIATFREDVSGEVDEEVLSGS